jgi:hypothetical protein
MSYPEPRRVVMTWTDVRGMTILERTRACTLAGIGAADVDTFVRGVAAASLSPEDLERGVILLYAIGYQLEKRLDPSLTWEAMQAVDLAFDLETPADPALEAEARATVEAAVATGLPPDEAGKLTMREVDAYLAIRSELTEAGR